MRFIPTCVGNMQTPPSRCQSRSVHPHVCGEHSTPTKICTKKYGSSPRVWGTLPMIRQPHFQRRFIPTCVGNISRSHMTPSSLAVHPHVCGEHRRLRKHLTQQHGSSPRVWGTLKGIRNGLVFPRFIPTCVGNIIGTTINPVQSPVHPHVCGEHSTFRNCLKDCFGSSPRVWGTWLYGC